MKPEDFMKLCKKSGIKWAVFVQDASHCWYHRGLQDGDSRGFEGVIELLQVAPTPHAVLHLRLHTCPAICPFPYRY